MTLYMYQASYTAKSMAAQLTEPHDPMEAIRPTLDDLGATIVVAGFPFGEYDVLIVYEAPDDVTAASVAMAVAAAGEVKSAKTTRLLSGQEPLDLRVDARPPHAGGEQRSADLRACRVIRVEQDRGNAGDAPALPDGEGRPVAVCEPGPDDLVQCGGVGRNGPGHVLPHAL